MSEVFMQPVDGSTFTCGQCGTKIDGDALGIISDFEERVSPGEICPAGECPKCFALVHYADGEEPDWSPQFQIRKLREALLNICLSSNANDYGSLMNAIAEGAQVIHFKAEEA